jgi:hypothetical protein
VIEVEGASVDDSEALLVVVVVLLVPALALAPGADWRR